MKEEIYRFFLTRMNFPYVCTISAVTERACLDVAWKDIGTGHGPRAAAATAPRSRATNIAHAITHVTVDTNVELPLYLVYFSSTLRSAISARCAIFTIRVCREFYILSSENPISRIYTFGRCISHLNVTCAYRCSRVPRKARKCRIFMRFSRVPSNIRQIDSYPNSRVSKR